MNTTVAAFLLIFSVQGLPSSSPYGPESIPATDIGRLEERNGEQFHEFCANFSQGKSGRMWEFSTPNYPHFYPPDIECIRVMHVPQDYTVLLDFRGVFFELERLEGPKWTGGSSLHHSLGSSSNCAFDYLEVRNGPYGFSPLIGRYCGNKFPPVIAADSGSMWVMFRSDHSIQYRGFRAVQYAAPKLALPGVVKYNTHACSRVLNPLHTDAVISTEEVQTVYSDSISNGTQMWPVECVWRIESSSTAHKIRLYFEKFDLVYPKRCTMNAVEIYAHTTSKSNLVNQICVDTTSYVDTRSHLVFVRIVLAESPFLNTAIRAVVIPYARGNDCTKSMFSCGDDTCIPRSLVCNNRMDCYTNRDEKDCEEADTTLVDFFNSPYLAIFLTIILLILSIISCMIFVNLRHRMEKHRFAYRPTKQDENTGLTTPPSPSFRSSDHHRRRELQPLLIASGPVGLVYSSQVPGMDPNHNFPAVTNDQLHFYACQRGTNFIGPTSVKLQHPFWSPFVHHSYQAPAAIQAISPSPDQANTKAPKGISCQLWTPSPSTKRVQCPFSNASQGTNTPQGRGYKVPPGQNRHSLVRCSSQSTVSACVNEKIERRNVHFNSPRKKDRLIQKKPSFLATSKAFYHTRSTSSSMAVASEEHKFWARMEDLITTTEESDAAEPKRKRPLISDNDADNLSDLANGQSSNDEGKE